MDVSLSHDASGAFQPMIDTLFVNITLYILYLCSYHLQHAYIFGDACVNPSVAVGLWSMGRMPAAEAYIRSLSSMLAAGIIEARMLQCSCHRTICIYRHI